MADATILYHPTEAPRGNSFGAGNMFLEKLVHEGWVDDPAKIGVNVWDKDNPALNEFVAEINDMFLSGEKPNIGGKGHDQNEMELSSIGGARCAIWGTYASYSEQQGDGKYIDSPRAGGNYRITRRAETILQRSRAYDAQVKARLTTWLVEQRLQGIECPLVNEHRLEDSLNLQSITVEERANRFLQFALNQAPDIGDYVSLSDPNVTCLAIAWSESTDMKSVLYLANQLTKEGFLAEGRLPNGGRKYVLTTKGHARLTDLETKQEGSRQAFVALWFDDNTTAAWEHGLMPGIKDAGFEPFRIDLRDDVNKIDDEIIREIRRSRFLVADLTHGKQGARGSVYYEAGFAHALEIPVIFTCREDLKDNIPFDTRQYYHIFWKSPEELRGELTKRIGARIGRIRRSGTS